MDEVLTSIPDSLQRLARLVSRAFYSLEHVIVIDMLIRNPCMREEDLADLLKFERKQLRTVIAQLKNDKFIKVRLRMETGPDGKATRQNYYYINYKVFVNVVKYKLDHMLRKIETEERDSTSRASFKCPTCLKTFTDLEADQLCDFATGEFRCTFCNTVVEEDQSALPKKDSRLLLAKFNEQIEPLYNLLREVEDIKLAPELLEPEPTDLSSIKNDPKLRPIGRPGEHGAWSGDATRSRDYGIEQDVSISFGDNVSVGAAQPKKERPIWMVESTVAPEMKEEIVPLPPVLSIPETSLPSTVVPSRQEDIMEVLLAHEKKGGLSAPIIPGAHSEDSNTSESEMEATAAIALPGMADVEEMDDEDDEEVSMVTVADRSYPLHEVTEELVAQMTPSEKEVYIKLMQEVYSNIYE